MVAVWLAAIVSAQRPARTPDIFFVPTWQPVVYQMLELAGVTKDDVVYDLGSGDGRIVVLAAQKYGARGVGIELDPRLVEISRQIPDDIDWVLRVDGHTDRQPINTFAFPSNWELSTARAVSVVKFLIEQGIPGNRLAATGFGEYQPLEAGSDEIAFRRNRRIEFKLTER